jgi:CelD/BcsL family acetyltransferase involved in cellulose biosynthesis
MSAALVTLPMEIRPGCSSGANLEAALFGPTQTEGTTMNIATATGARRRADEVQFRLIYLSTLPAFLLGAAVSRVLRARDRRPGSGLTIVGEAKAAASTCGSFALMG